MFVEKFDVDLRCGFTSSKHQRSPRPPQSLLLVARGQIQDPRIRSKIELHGTESRRHTIQSPRCNNYKWPHKGRCKQPRMLHPINIHPSTLNGELVFLRSPKPSTATLLPGCCNLSGGLNRAVAVKVGLNRSLGSATCGGSTGDRGGGGMLLDR